MTGCSIRPGDLFQIQTIVIADITELLIHCKVRFIFLDFGVVELDVGVVELNKWI